MDLTILSPSVLPTMTAYTFWSYQLQAGGGTPPYIWSVVNYNSSPDWMNNPTIGGLLSGTGVSDFDEVPGTQLLTMRVTDFVGTQVDKTFSIPSVHRTDCFDWSLILVAGPEGLINGTGAAFGGTTPAVFPHGESFDTPHIVVGAGALRCSMCQLQFSWTISVPSDARVRVMANTGTLATGGSIPVAVSGSSHVYFGTNAAVSELWLSFLVGVVGASVTVAGTIQNLQ